MPSKPTFSNAQYLMTKKERTAARSTIQAHFRAILETLGIDVDNDHNTQNTPSRFAKMLVDELFEGRFASPPKITVFPNVKHIDQMVAVGPLTVKSVCSHHFMPIVGYAWIAYMPQEKLIGLSKFPRVVEWFARRPQIQEEMTDQIADYLFQMLDPAGLGVYVRAKHFCMSHRGVNESPNAFMDTVSLRGNFLSSPSIKAEFLALTSRPTD